ncbi:MAG TPA: hypothetical protein VF913_06395 [Xanthobacteraceae bacterium]
MISRSEAATKDAADANGGGETSPRSLGTAPADSGECIGRGASFRAVNMPAKKPVPKRRGPPKPRDRAKKRQDEAALEQALEDTFPSSDPVALTQPTIAAKKKLRR